MAAFIALSIALQSAAASPVTGAAPIDFDLAKARPAPSGAAQRACGSGEGGEIVVCGRREGSSRYRLEELDNSYAEGPLGAELSIGKGATLRAYTEQVEMPGGLVSKRMMIGIKTKF